MDIQNLIFEGGGVRGIAYGGAIERLHEYGLYEDVKNVAGSSAGAICAAILASGYKPDQLTDMLIEIDYSKFADNSFGFIRDSLRFIKRYGWNKGDYFEQWLGKMVLRPNITMKELYDLNIGPKLYIIASNVTTGHQEIISHETHPNLPVVTAVRASMAYPFFFTPVKINDCYYVDGGLLNNFPVKIFEDTEKTIGFSLVQRDECVIDEYNEIKKIPIKSVFGYIKSVIMSMHTNLQDAKITGFPKEQIIEIDIGSVPVLKFDLTATEIDFMIDAGRKAMEEFL